MVRTTFRVAGMDCAAEEAMIRMALQDIVEVRAVECNLPDRTVAVVHTGGDDQVARRLDGLGLGASFVTSEPVEDAGAAADQAAERTVLWQVLTINFVFFVLEVGTGFVVHSMGLVADGLDMLADSIVYGLALLAVGGSVARKKGIARTTGYFQLILASAGFAEVFRRSTGAGGMPEYGTMIVLSCFALAANALSLYLLQRHRSPEAHIRATMICTSNDVIANAGVIVAGILVLLTDSRYPDLVIGTIVLALVFRGAWRILQLARA